MIFYVLYINILFKNLINVVKKEFLCMHLKFLVNKL